MLVWGLRDLAARYC